MSPDDPDVAKAAWSLARRDPVLRSILKLTGPPRWRARPGGYQGLARIIIEQQLSVASANAILARCKEATNDLCPNTTATADPDDLRALGLSRPKIRYLKALSEDVRSGAVDLDALRALDDREAHQELCKILGIGPWTASVYLLFCEGRCDLWPKGDVALLAAHSGAGGPFTRAEISDFDAMADQTYAPHRGVAAHLLWGYIAHQRGRAPL
ncbi:MAG: DNA-3-methyladenine glycosylase 2 family protein [Pseudomonadota bacterium]